jgi:branched-chain amino acid transport system permease protein
VDQFLQHLVNAVILGGTYALLGIGLTLIFGIMRVVNFTHGELYAFGAYTVYLVAAALGVDFFLGLMLAIIAGVLLGALMEIVLLRPMRSADIDTVMLVMIGAWIVMQNTELLVWGGAAKAIVTPFPDAPLAIGRALMSRPKLILFDEPSLGLAPTIVERMFDIVTGIRNSGTTVLMVEQNASAALDICDHAYLLESGSLAIEGSGRELIDNPHIRAAYLAR